MRLSGPRPVASQMGVCEEDYYCKPALPTHTLSQRPTFTRPTFHSTILCTARPARELHFYLVFKRGKSGTVIDGDSVTGAGRECSRLLPLCAFSQELISDVIVEIETPYYVAFIYNV